MIGESVRFLRSSVSHFYILRGTIILFNIDRYKINLYIITFTRQQLNPYQSFTTYSYSPGGKDELCDNVLKV